MSNGFWRWTGDYLGTPYDYFGAHKGDINAVASGKSSPRDKELSAPGLAWNAYRDCKLYSTGGSAGLYGPIKKERGPSVWPRQQN